VRKLSAVLFVCSTLFLIGTVHAQEIDAQFGVSGVHSKSVNSFDFSDFSHSPEEVGGGIFPSLGGDVLLWKNVGVGGQIAWKGGQGFSQLAGLNYRPILWDVDAVYARRAGRIGFAGMGGIGGESVRFYGIQNCNSFSCTNFVSSNHFLTHLGTALRLYATHSIYVGPQIDYYFVKNNFEFTSNNVTRYGVNIGFTFGK